jgi:hypothetical protein
VSLTIILPNPFLNEYLYQAALRCHAFVTFLLNAMLWHRSTGIRKRIRIDEADETLDDKRSG